MGVGEERDAVSGWKWWWCLGWGGAVAHVYVRKEELVPDRRLNLSNSCPQQSFQEEKEEKC